MKVLFVTAILPCPPHGGERIRAYNIIDSLSRNFEVAVLAPKAAERCDLHQQVERWHNLPNQGRSGMGQNAWYTLRPRPSWATSIAAIMERFRPAITWFDADHWGQYEALARRFGSRTIMDTHNIQSDLIRQMRPTFSLGRRYLANVAITTAQHMHERRLFPRFNRVVSVGEADRQYHAQFVGQARSKLIPNYINEAWYQLPEPTARADDLVTMTGNFNSLQSREGAAWYLAEVWPHVREQLPRARVQFVGRGSAEMIGPTDDERGIRGVGEVGQVAPYLRRAALAAVPIFHGSGTRLKILEALACSTPVISTTLGAQGIDLVSGESAVLADSATDFARATIDLLRNRDVHDRMAQAGLAVLRRSYGFEVNTERIRRLVEQVALEPARP